MFEQRRISKAGLIAQIDREWDELQGALSRLTPHQATELRDRQGWSVKDHLTHLVAWERSVVYFLEGKPRHEGVGVAQAVYEDDDVDKINAAVQQNTADVSLDDAKAELRAVHTRMLALLEPLGDDDLLKPYRAFLPDEPGEGDGPPAYEVISGNSGEHFREHREWIKQLTMNDEG